MRKSWEEPVILGRGSTSLQHSTVAGCIPLPAAALQIMTLVPGPCPPHQGGWVKGQYAVVTCRATASPIHFHADPLLQHVGSQRFESISTRGENPPQHPGRLYPTAGHCFTSYDPGPWTLPPPPGGMGRGSVCGCNLSGHPNHPKSFALPPGPD